MGNLGWGINVGAILLAVGLMRMFSSGFLFGRRRSRYQMADPDPALARTVEELQARVAELEQVQTRVAELEERLDFAERMFSTQRENERLGPPKP